MKTPQLALTATLLTLFASPALPQTGSGSPPPAYDYNASAPGIQAPSFLGNSAHDYRSVRQYQVSIPVLVPLRELQAIMPPGFTAVATPSGSNQATVSLGLFLDQRFEIVANGQSYGPVSALLVSTTALNGNVSPARQELVFPSFQASGEIPALEQAFGAGSVRLANVDVRVVREANGMNFHFEVVDAGIGLRLRADLQTSAALNTRFISDPVGLPFRTFSGLVPNQAFRAASQSDGVLVPSAWAVVRLRTPGQRLNFPAGSLSIVGLGENVTFSRNVEFVIKYE